VPAINPQPLASGHCQRSWDLNFCLRSEELGNLFIRFAKSCWLDVSPLEIAKTAKHHESDN
jgi:hypothetical protein